MAVFKMMFASLLLILIAASFPLVNSANVNEADRVSVECESAARSCRIEFNKEGSSDLVSFTMKETKHDPLFSPDLKVHQNDVPFGQINSQRDGERSYRAERGLASATIRQGTSGGFTLVQGIFVLEDTVVQFKREGMSSSHSSLRSVATGASRRRLWNNFRATSTNPILFYNASAPGSCYPNDNVQHIARISVVLDWGMVEPYSGLDPASIVTRTLEDVEDAFAVAKLVWISQLNIQLQIVNIELGSAASPSPINWSPASTGCGSASQAYTGIRNYVAARLSERDRWSGVTMLLSRCFGGFDAAGFALVGAFCYAQGGGVGVAIPDPVTVAHELGHLFGSDHSYENGVGVTGGIMDTGGPGTFQDSLQFHPARKTQVCNFLKSVINDRQCAYMTVSAANTCGDGILAPNEECECMPSSDPNARVTSCRDCQMCHVPNEDLECSLTAAIRKPDDRGYIQVTTSLLAHPECCNNVNQVPVGGTCNNGEDLCSVGGFCSSLCVALGFVPCGVGSGGCRQRCWVQGICTEAHPLLIAGGVVLNALPSGSACDVSPNTDLTGKCSNGICFGSDGTSSGTVTSTPTFPPRGTPTSRSPTARATAQPFSVAEETRAPSIRITKRPTPRPTPAPKAPTLSPCSAFRRRGACNRRSWCVWSARRCQVFPFAGTKAVQEAK